jgi:hypothetical protein
MQAVLVERAQALLSQAADVTAERLAMVRAQSERAGATGAEVTRVIRMAEESLEEKDPLTVMSMNEKFEQAISSLHDSGRLRSLEACTNEEIGLVVDFKVCGTTRGIRPRHIKPSLVLFASDGICTQRPKR